MSGFDLPVWCWAFGLGFLVFVVLVVGGVRRTDRRWSRAIDGHHARTGSFPTLADVSRPVRRLVAAVATAPTGADPDQPRWWLLDCPRCDLSVQVPATAEQIEAAVDRHNRVYHGTTPRSAGISPAAAAPTVYGRWAA